MLNNSKKILNKKIIICFRQINCLIEYYHTNINLSAISEKMMENQEMLVCQKNESKTTNE
jgi:hypothetical protein